MIGTKPQVLIVDEDSLLSEITSFRLMLLGYEIEAITSGEEALVRMAQRCPDLLVVGNALSDMEGIELLNRVSNDKLMGAVPALFLSPVADLDDVQQAFNAGADEYLVIPFDPLVLEQKVKRLSELQIATT